MGYDTGAEGHIFNSVRANIECFAGLEVIFFHAIIKSMTF